MGLESIQEGATNPVFPLIGESDLSVQLIVALFVGFVILALVRPASESAAEAVGDAIESVTDINPQTGDVGGNVAAYGGA